MGTVLLPVVLVIAQCKARLLFNSQHWRHLEVAPLVLVAGWLAHADKAAAIPDKALHRGGDFRVLPDGPAGVGGVPAADVQQHVHAVQGMGIGLQVVKAQEAHAEGRAGQGFDDPGVGVVLLLVQGVVNHVAAPGTGPAPAVQHRNGLGAVGLGPVDMAVQLPELLAHGFHIINELREFTGQLQVPAVADAVNGLAQDGPPGGNPVLPGLSHRVPSLVESVREEVGQEAPLGVLHPGDVGDEPQGGPVAHAAHHRVQADGLELLQVGLRADPVIPQEHHGLLA